MKILGIAVAEEHDAYGGPDVRELTSRLIQAQQERVFKGLAEEGAKANGLEFRGVIGVEEINVDDCCRSDPRKHDFDLFQFAKRIYCKTIRHGN
jgi:hypothetical protein